MRRTTYLTEVDSGHAVELSVGDSLEVTLPEHGGTGRWVAHLKGEGLQLDRETAHGFFLLTAEGHTVVHRFHAVGEGNSVLELRYEDPTNAGHADQRFRVAVTIGSPPPPKRARIVIEPARVSQLALWVFMAILLCVGLVLAGVRMVMVGQYDFQLPDVRLGAGLAVAGALLAAIFAGRLMNILFRAAERDEREQ